MYAIFNLCSSLGVFDIPIAISVRYGNCRGGVIARKAKRSWRYLQRAVLKRFNGLVDDGVHGIDYVVDEGLRKSLANILKGLARSKVKVLSKQRVCLGLSSRWLSSNDVRRKVEVVRDVVLVYGRA